MVLLQSATPFTIAANRAHEVQPTIWHVFVVNTRVTTACTNLAVAYFTPVALNWQCCL